MREPLATDQMPSNICYPTNPGQTESAEQEFLTHFSSYPQGAEDKFDLSPPVDLHLGLPFLNVILLKLANSTL